MASPALARHRISWRFFKRAGLTPWPKLFQNLRATRATELANEYPAHVAAEWWGHDLKVADKHYWRTTEDHFMKAVQKRCSNRWNVR